MNFSKVLDILRVIGIFLVAIAIFSNAFVMWEGVKSNRNKVVASVFFTIPELKSTAITPLLAGFSLEETLEHLYSTEHLFKE